MQRRGDHCEQVHGNLHGCTISGWKLHATCHTILHSWYHSKDGHIETNFDVLTTIHIQRSEMFVCLTISPVQLSKAIGAVKQQMLWHLQWPSMQLRQCRESRVVNVGSYRLGWCWHETLKKHQAPTCITYPYCGLQTLLFVMGSFCLWWPVSR